MIKLYHGDCLEIMDRLIGEGTKVDTIITDPPYGKLSGPCKQWDSMIPFDDMWPRLNKLIKYNGAIVLFGNEPFSSALRMSNLKQYKYDWIWEKNTASNFILAKYIPMDRYENISVFGNFGMAHLAKIQPCYYPQGIVKVNKQRVNAKSQGGRHKINSGHDLNKKIGKKYIQTHEGYPYRLIKFKKDQPSIHPTQKPVALMEYLIKTYTLPHETVLDFTMGSGSTGVACQNTDRNFIGIEKEEKYFNIAQERLTKE